MKIMHVISNLDQGGAETVLYRLVRETRSDTSHVVVSMRNRAYYGERLEEAGARVYALGMRRGRPSIRGVIELVRILKSERPAVVQTWMYHADLLGGLVARATGFTRVAWCIRNSDLDPRKTSRSTRAVARLCAWLSPRIPESIVCCSQRAIRLHTAIGYQAEKFVLVPNGYDLLHFMPDAVSRQRLRAALGVGDEMLLGMVARWDPQKDHSTLFSALTELKSGGVRFRCILAGHDINDSNGQLMALINAAGLRSEIILLGARDDVPAIMNAIDVHVLSSAYGEAFPNVVAEAMACGTPAVVTDVGDAATIVGNELWVSKPGDPSALAAAIVRAATAVREKGDLVGAECRKRIVENYAMSKMVAGFRSVWGRAAS